MHGYDMVWKQFVERKKSCPRLDSKSVPSACEPGALPSELLGRVLQHFCIAMYGTTKSAVSPIRIKISIISFLSYAITYDLCARVK